MYTEEKLKALLAEHGQEQLLKYWDKLNEAEKERLGAQINALDFSLLDLLKRDNMAVPKGKLEPLGAMTLSDIAAKGEDYRKTGLGKIREGKVAAVMLAGGQGTRLGSDKPKGMYDIGLTHTVYIFQRLFENLMEITNEAGAWAPLYIMTSDKNYDDTVAFLREKKFFGYSEEHVTFFRQELAPSVGFDGKILLEAPDSVSLSPNGNGGWFSSMVRCGLLPQIKAAGVEYFNVFAVDNVLQRICDPCFIGAVAGGGYDGGAKVVRKATPDERVGVLCLEDGAPSIVEYYEMTEEMVTRRNADGELAYNFGVILNYLFRVDHLEDILGSSLPIHVVEKKIPHLDENGVLVKPTEPNGFKFETLILDMVHLMNSCLSYEVDRAKEFAPIKNKTGIDSVESARALVQAQGIIL